MAQYSILNTQYSILNTQYVKQANTSFSSGLVPRLIVVAFLFARINSRASYTGMCLNSSFLLCETSNGERKIMHKRLKFKEIAKIIRG